LMFEPPPPEGSEENRPRRVKNPAETEPSPLDLNSINQRKFVRHPQGRRDEVIGIDFWHAVEFSRTGRAPSPDTQAWIRGYRSCCDLLTTTRSG
jgi:hypothetical protein